MFVKSSLIFAVWEVLFLVPRCLAQKSFRTNNPSIRYAEINSFVLNPNQIGLLQETLKSQDGVMAGSPEVIRMNMILIKSIGAKRILDVGLFTGNTALAAALASPPDAKIIGIDVNGTHWERLGKGFAQRAGVTSKIDVRIHDRNAANIVLDELIQQGESGRFDFCFIDANKDQYLDYYKKCKQLVRSGGFITIDNVIWGVNPMTASFCVGNHQRHEPVWCERQGRSAHNAAYCSRPDRGVQTRTLTFLVIWGANPVTASASAIDVMNQFVVKDKDVMPTMLPIAQGLTVVYKL